MLSTASRAGLLMEVLTSSIRPRIVARYPDPFAHLPAGFAKEKQHLDASACLQILRRRSRPFVGDEFRVAEQLATALISFRNDWAHQRDISEAQLRSAIRNAEALLQLLRDPLGALSAQAMLAPADALAGAVADLLIKLARLGRTVSYSEAADQLGLSNSIADRRKLYVRLTASGSVDRTIGAPLLCSLVVLGEDDTLGPYDAVGIPGGGYYWLVDTDRDAQVSTKKRRHGQELRRVFAHYAKK